MRNAAKALFAAVLAALSPVLPAAAQSPGFPQTMPPNTVYGRSGISTGPGQAIPFSIIIQTLSNQPNTWTTLQTFGAGLAITNASVNFTAATAIDGASSNSNSFPKGAYFGNNGIGVYSAFTGAVDTPNTSTLVGSYGLSGYSRCAGTVTNCVGSFGAGLMSGDLGGSNGTWGGNWVATNSPTTGPVTNTGLNFGALIAGEFDCNVIKRAGVAPTGQTNCVLITGASETQSTTAMNALTITFAGASPWHNAINIGNGAGDVSAIFIGATATGGTNSSLPIFMAAYNGGALVTKSMTLTPALGFQFNASLGSTQVGGSVYHAPATGGASINLLPTTASQGGFVNFFDAGTAKWQLGNTTGNVFALFDSANASAIAFQVSTGGNTTLGESGKAVAIQGTLTLPSTSIIPATTGTPAASLCIDASNNIIKKTTTGACI